MPRGLALLKETRGLLNMRKLSFTYSLSTQGHCKPARALKQKGVPHPQTLTLVPKPREPVLLRIWDLGQGRGCPELRSHTQEMIKSGNFVIWVPWGGGRC